jgi:hypothetical protein
METNFLTKYEERLSVFENLIQSDPDNSEQHNTDMIDYMISCIPYISRYSETDVKSSKRTNFNTKTKQGVKRGDIYHEYLENMENIDTGLAPMRTSEFTRCTDCNSLNICADPSAIFQVCMDCGITKEIMVCEMTYREEHEFTEKIISYSYKRSNHFQEWLNQLQATESTNIPPEVVDSLRSEFKKMKIKNVSEITHAKVRTLLKKLRMNRYYEHVPYIANMLNGIPPMRMSAELQDRLKMMFNEIQTPFEKHCPENRKNFLSYAYVLYKFCELLSEDEYLKYFPLLKSREKLYIQDSIWKNICKELQWEFIATL